MYGPPFGIDWKYAVLAELGFACLLLKMTRFLRIDMMREFLLDVDDADKPGLRDVKYVLIRVYLRLIILSCFQGNNNLFDICVWPGF